MANGRVMRQCFANHAQADCNAYGFDEDKINLGLELEKKASTHILQHPGLSGIVEVSSDTSVSFPPVPAAGHWSGPQTEESRLSKVMRLLRPYNNILKREQSLIEDQRLQTNSMTPTQSPGCSC